MGRARGRLDAIIVGRDAAFAYVHTSIPLQGFYMMEGVDVVVVGGGHAGIEAAHASAKLGAAVALILPNPTTIGLMPCNPAIGGPGKSQIVYEIHALGGVMGSLADETAIHARTLNASKGPAVQSLRVQNERDGYAEAARHLIESTSGITIVRGEVADLVIEGSSIAGVRLTNGRSIATKAVVLCTGTFLRGTVWYGKSQREAGRQGEPPAKHLSKSLKATNHTLLRFKTGTPPRIRADSVDFSVLEEVASDSPPSSFTGAPGQNIMRSPTWLTHTTPGTHRLIQENLEHSAMYGGEISGQGPRYCPSIEDKVVRFSDKNRHLLFVEPDGIETSEVYLQGFSSSMPPHLQDDMIRTLPGFERAVIQRYAYAVEYDVLDPNQLDASLMSKRTKGLFSAGQVNGTSGYEEAAAQGLLAGVNAARYSSGERAVALSRSQGYIGVLIDDLTRWHAAEPYRMLTSRNEYRLLHRQDNAQERLSPTAFDWGLINKQIFDGVKQSNQAIKQEIERLERSVIDGKMGTAFLCRPDASYDQVVDLIGPAENRLTSPEKKKLEIDVKYRAYIERTQKELEKWQGYENLGLNRINYNKVHSLSNEGCEVLKRNMPGTMGAARRIKGLRDSDLTALLVHLKGNKVSRETIAR